MPIMLLCRFLRGLQEPSTGAETFGVLLRIKCIELKLLNVASAEISAVQARADPHASVCVGEAADGV